MSICFPNFWISYDLKWEIDELWGNEHADNGAISIGYETSAKSFSLDYEDETNIDNLNTSHINFGASFDIIGARRNNISEQGKMINIYSKYIIPIKKINNISFLWCSAGYSFPIDDFEDYLSAGPSYELGILHKEGIGLYYIVSNLRYGKNESEIDITRLGLSYHF